MFVTIDRLARRGTVVFFLTDTKSDHEDCIKLGHKKTVRRRMENMPYTDLYW
jgi:hypothetical protein